MEAADSIEVAFPDGTMMAGIVKQSEYRYGTVRGKRGRGPRWTASSLRRWRPSKLGNSYGVKQGDMVVAIGAPAGIVHSSDYGNISYVARNVHTVDGSSRVFLYQLAPAGARKAGTCFSAEHFG
ncbi:MAG: hypothetical protein ACLR0U_25310 [Enterocloster clostridioformis]